MVIYLVKFDAVVVRFLFNKQEQNNYKLSIITTLDSKTSTEIDMTARCRRKKNQKKVRRQLCKSMLCKKKCHITLMWSHWQNRAAENTEFN